MRKLLIALCLFSTAAVRAQQITTEQYIKMYKDIAIAEMQRTGVPAAISLAQGIVESQSGNGWLVQHSNNHFGIKCRNWNGPTILYDDDRKNECFRKYDAAEDSWKDHSDFLKNNIRYAFLFRFEPTDYKDWAYGLKQAGYATSATYPQKLLKAIEDYNLGQYTLVALQPAANNRQEAIAAAQQQETNVSTGPADDHSAAASAPAATVTAQQYPSGQFTINSRKVLYLPAGSPLLPVAERYHIKLRKLVSFNELKDDQPLASSSLVFLERKSKTGASAYHTVEPGEDMHTIAQEEGIQLSWLYKRNKMQEGQEPASGQKLLMAGYAAHSPQLLPAGEAAVNSADAGQGKFSPQQMVRDAKNNVNALLGKK